MLTIIKKHAERGRGEARRLLENATVKTLPESLKYKPGEEKLKYWGLSYGTFLGTTFAAKYPERVGRLVLDGVVDANDYAAALWYNNLLDTERAMDSFYFHCARVGFPACALACPSSEETTPTQVKNRTKNIVDNLFQSPLPVPEQHLNVTCHDVLYVICSSLYRPIGLFPVLADNLAQIELGNGTEFALQFLSDDARTNKKKPATSSIYNPNIEIACSDADDLDQVSQQSFERYVTRLMDISPTGAPFWHRHRLQCIHYKTRAYYRFRGPWKGKTSHPLLMIGNTADSVTPLA